MSESSYIRKRKLKAAINSLAFYICRIFPIDKKLVSVCTFEGKGGFGCNPKYLVQEIHKEDYTVKFDCRKGIKSDKAILHDLGKRVAF